MKRWLIVTALVLGLLGTLWTVSCDMAIGSETASAPCHYSSAAPLATGLIVTLMVGLPAFAALYGAPKSLVLIPVRIEDETPHARHTPPPPPPPRWY